MAFVNTSAAIQKAIAEEKRKKREAEHAQHVREGLLKPRKIKPKQVVERYKVKDAFVDEMKLGIRQFVIFGRNELNQPGLPYWTIKQPVCWTEYVKFCAKTGHRQMRRLQFYAHLVELGFVRFPRADGDYLNIWWPD